MTGFQVALGACCACGSTFSFNPERVPSFEGDPICRGCIDEVNRRRREAGRPEWPVLPGAYDVSEAT